MKEKLKILVADDIEIIAKNMQSMIATNENVEKVHIALDGEDAFIQILNFEPDIVFIDNQMPKRTGIELIEYIKDFPNLDKKPQFILVTADRGSDLINKSIELGFKLEYKPISKEMIYEYIYNFEPIVESEEEKKAKEQAYQEELRLAREEIKKETFLRKLLKKKIKHSD